MEFSLRELRSLAQRHEAGDAGDLYVKAACHIYGVSPDRVTREMRESAKAVCYQLMWGSSC